MPNPVGSACTGHKFNAYNSKQVFFKEKKAKPQNLPRNPVHSIDLAQHWHQIRLREDVIERYAGFIDGVQESHQLPAQLPVACRDRVG
jgi:hypothetical protein